MQDLSAGHGPVVDFTATLPRKRMAAGALFFNAAEEVLLVQPSYKSHWEIPGGGVERDESPHTACCREIREELGIDRPPTDRVLALDWVPPRGTRAEGLIVIFDGGRLTDDDIAAITLPADELLGHEFCTLQRADALLPDLLARRLAASLDARQAGTTAYLENGRSAAAGG